jgi:23S rRNA pseudouridine2605 synthase
MRLNRYLAACGFGSRRAVESWIREGLVVINGQACLDLGRQVGEVDEVFVDGRKATLPAATTCMALYKPAGYLCSRTDPAGKPLVFSLLPPKWRGLHYVGRLDFLSRGLLLLTDDGILTQALLHPSREVERVYQVSLSQPLAAEDIAALRQGFVLEDGLRTLPARVKHLKTEGEATYELTLREGKNREIRRMMSSFGLRVQDLCRVQYGPIGLDGLAEGEWRILSNDELQLLRHVCGLSPGQGDKVDEA